MTRRIRPKPFYELGRILQDYSLNGDKTNAVRRLNMQAYNYARKDMVKHARLFRLLKRELNKRR